MKNIHILPTDKPSRLHFTEFFEELVFTPKYEKLDGVNIYITSDEEIKEGDWFYDLDTKYVKVKKSWENSHLGFNGKKIILTTDQDLIKDGVQAIDNEFLEWFVKNPSCEVIEVAKVKIINYSFPRDVYNKYKIIIPKEELKSFSDFSDKFFGSIPKEEPKRILTEEDIFNQKDIDVVTDYINKEQHYQYLIDMMKDDEELGLYDETEHLLSTQANRNRLLCKDCSDSLEDCTCIEDIIDFPRQEIKLEEVFNDDKKENIKKFIDEINNPSQPNDKLKQAFEKYSEYLEDYENKNTYEHGFKDGAKCQQEISYSEEEVIAFGEFIFKHSLLTHTRGVKSLFEQFIKQLKKK